MWGNSGSWSFGRLLSKSMLQKVVKTVEVGNLSESGVCGVKQGLRQKHKHWGETNKIVPLAVLATMIFCPVSWVTVLCACFSMDIFSVICVKRIQHTCSIYYTYLL